MFNGEKALEHVRVMVKEIGSRFAGLESEKRAADYILKCFQEFGYTNAHFQPFPLELDEVWDMKLSVDGLGEVPCLPILGSDDCPDGVSGPIYFIEGNNLADLETTGQGKILLMEGELESSRGEQYQTIVACRPAALIMMNADPNNPPRSIDIFPERRRLFGSLTLAQIDYHEGQKLRELNGTTAHLSLRSSCKTATAFNVICEIEGSEHPDEIITICGHFDTVLCGPGAIDNAAGASIVMELARIFKHHGSKRTLRFIAISGEEQGLRGSSFYVRELLKGDRPELDKHVLALNIDIQGAMPGSSSGWVIGPQDIFASIRLLSAELDAETPAVDGIYSSDGLPFSGIGIPSVTWSRGGGEGCCGHTTTDRFECVKAEGLAASGVFIEQWMRRYVTDSIIYPFERTVPEEKLKNISDYFKVRDTKRTEEG
jgi:hypothetical protein